MNSSSMREQMVAEVHSIIKKRMSRWSGMTRAELPIPLADFESMSGPDVFCDVSSVEHPSFKTVVFYDLLSQVLDDEVGRFAEMVINKVVDDPHCECAANLSHMDAFLDVSTSVVNRFLRKGKLPGRLDQRLSAHKPAEESFRWPVGSYANS